MKTRGLL